MKQFTILVVIVMLNTANCVGTETGATLRTQGDVLVNGSPAPSLFAIFPKDIIETQKGALALIELAGSRIEVGVETIVEFNGNELRLEHGSLSVLTFQSLRVQVGCIVAIPVHSEQTLYAVVDNTGLVSVSALKNDVNIKNSLKNSKKVTESDRTKQVTVRQGEQKSRNEKCGVSQIESRTAAAGIGGVFSSPYAQGVALVGTVGALCWLFCVDRDPPISPAAP